MPGASEGFWGAWGGFVRVVLAKKSSRASDARTVTDDVMQSCSYIGLGFQASQIADGWVCAIRTSSHIETPGRRRTVPRR